ncbi:MAG: iron-sulfur cluster repair di-iron protein [Ignavibacteriae bacterium]|nr:iron-sulfur cluster repair di-iron protein [Ignavibacteriota bacterium]MCB9215768.1 iron-sulfur cluster repair di-iron protein [Ignavibacteria bacterium]
MNSVNELVVAPNSTVREVVAEDFRTAAIFQKYGLDFCCGGGATIERSCQKKGVNADLLIAELRGVMEGRSAEEPRFNQWSVDLLINYILQNHHSYIRSVLPTILGHAEKVARVHGGANPSLVEVAEKFRGIAEDMTSHIAKEERILFPYIQYLSQVDSAEKEIQAPSFGSVQNPIQMMEVEHQLAGDEMEEMRRLTNNYTPPAEACTTYRVLFQELQEFEQDLHRHIHLENNILFPKAIQLEQSIQREDEVTRSESVV